MKLLFKLLKQNISFLQTTAFLLINLLGGVIVLTGVEAYRDFSSLTSDENGAFSSTSVIINKSLGSNATLNSILGLHPSFSDEDIAELEALPSVSSVGKFINARFEVGAVLSVASARMSSEIFLEAVPDEFIVDDYTPVSGVSKRWTASLASDTIPVVIPRNYLNLYNFGFATANGMPQISNDIIGYLPLKLIFDTPRGSMTYNAVLCGLTDKFNTILVPWDFLCEANETFVPGVKDKPSRLILTTESKEFDEATFEFLEEKGYLVEGETMQVRLQNFVYGLLYIIIGIGAIFSILAFVLLVISILLLIEKNKEKISNLFAIGYSPRRISRIYRIMALFSDVVVWALAAYVTISVYPRITGVVQVVAPEFELVSLTQLWYVAAVLALAFAIVHGIIIYRSVRKHCKKH